AFVICRIAAVPEPIRTRTQSAVALLDGLQSMRGRAMNLSSDVSEIIEHYTIINNGLIESLSALPSVASETDLAQMLTAYVAFVRAKEQAGIERAQVASGFVSAPSAPA